MEAYNTPIFRLDTQSRSNEIFIKRDDFFPDSFGGNKARKAVNFFREIDQQAYNAVVTYGSSSSNHARIIANLAARRGLECYIISPGEKREETFNAAMMKKFGAEIIFSEIDDVKKTIDKTCRRLEGMGKKIYFIKGGGHGNLGTEAYVAAYKEILEYEARNNCYFDYIFHASGTGTTQAGLMCGKIISNDRKRRIVGISIARKYPYGREVIADSIEEYLQEHGDFDRSADRKVEFIDEYICEGYGTYNEQIQETIRELIKKEGIPLDSTYTGKAFWGMKSYLKKNKIHDKKILFIHTGGIPLFFDDLRKGKI